MGNEILDKTLYPAGAKICEVCSDPLPAVVCWSGRKHFVCLSCAKVGVRPLQLISRPKCDARNCPNRVPPRLYSGKPRVFFCSSRCAQSYKYARKSFVTVQCTYCGNQLRRLAIDAAGSHFCVGHYTKYIGEQRDKSECGRFFKLYTLVMENFCKGHYTNIVGARCELRQFFRFLEGKNIANLNDVTSDVVSGFLARPGRQYGRADYVKKMFDFLIRTGRFKKPHPVIPRLHYKHRRTRVVLPYSDQEMGEIWATLEDRGSTQAKLIISAAEDFGPRRAEMCKWRIPDINWRRKCIHIRNPTKTFLGGEVPLSSRTASLLKAWLRERGNCSHDSIFINGKGEPLSRPSFHYLMQGTLLKNWHGQVRQVGLDTFRFHRLRHRNATRLNQAGIKQALNMKIHMWRKRSSLQHYLSTNEREIAENVSNSWQAIESTISSLSAVLLKKG